MNLPAGQKSKSTYSQGMDIRPSRLIIFLMVLPAMVMLILFYTLAAHMHHELGNWPTSLGIQNFSIGLQLHAQIADDFWGVMFLVCVFALPPVHFVSLLKRRWWLAAYLGIYFFACLIALAGTFLAPAQFLNWWWD
jgi:hypothetical protein